MSREFLAHVPDAAVSRLEPIALIYEREGLPHYELPLELHGLYGGDFGLPERSVYANFVSTIEAWSPSRRFETRTA